MRVRLTIPTCIDYCTHGKFFGKLAHVIDILKLSLFFLKDILSLNRVLMK